MSDNVRDMVNVMLIMFGLWKVLVHMLFHPKLEMFEQEISPEKQLISLILISSSQP